MYIVYKIINYSLFIQLFLYLFLFVQYIQHSKQNEILVMFTIVSPPAAEHQMVNRMSVLYLLSGFRVSNWMAGEWLAWSGIHQLFSV